MPRRDIAMHLPPHGIKNVDVEIAVRSDDELLGTLRISKGSIDWRSAKNTKYSYVMGWERSPSAWRATESVGRTESRRRRSFVGYHQLDRHGVAGTVQSTLL